MTSALLKYRPEIFGVTTPRLTFACALIAALAVIGLLSGCRRPPVPVGRVALLRAHNDNADLIDGIWAKADIEISLAPLGPLTSIRLMDGRLYYRRNPADPSGAPYFMLRGMEATVEMFRLGTDPASGEFHCWMDTQSDEQPSWALTGRIDDLRLVEGNSLTAIDPVNLAAAMGIVPWPQDPQTPRQAIVRVVDDPCVYEVSLVGRVDAWGGWSLLRREIIDRYDKTLRPQEIHIHDRLGRDAMRVEILKYSPIQSENTADGTQPYMASDIILYPPESTGVRWVRIRISGATTGNDEQAVPPFTSFRTRIPSYIQDIRRLQPDR